jgi:hypothetical protein
VLELDIREYDLVGEPETIDDVAMRVRALLEEEIPQLQLIG